MLETKFNKLLCALLASLCLLLASEVFCAEQVVKIQSLSAQPQLDGIFSEWIDVVGVVINLKKNRPDAWASVNRILIKAGTFLDTVYFYLEWADDSEDLLHKPWVWDKQKNKYTRGPQREDRLALQFAMKGDYSTDWFSGNEFVADMWHWKSSRSNPLSLAHDKVTTISQQKIIRAAKFMGRNNQHVYISRSNDSGDKLYISKRYRKYTKDLLPKYTLSKEPKGSITDVKAKGIWKNGKWYLELARKLNTGNADDVVFMQGRTITGGIAIFNHSENDDHNISDNILFQF